MITGKRLPLIEHYKELLVQSLSKRIPDEPLNISQSAEHSSLWSFMMEPNTTVMWNALAIVYFTLERYNEAENAIKESLDIDTSNSWTWQLWGDLLIHQGRMDEAEQVYRMSIGLEPKNIGVLYELLLLQMARNAPYQAMETLTYLIEILPNNQELWDTYTKCVKKSDTCCLLESCVLRNAFETQT